MALEICNLFWLLPINYLFCKGFVIGWDSNLARKCGSVFAASPPALALLLPSRFHVPLDIFLIDLWFIYKLCLSNILTNFKDLCKRFTNNENISLSFRGATSIVKQCTQVGTHAQRAVKIIDKNKTVRHEITKKKKKKKNQSLSWCMMYIKCMVECHQAK